MSTRDWRPAAALAALILIWGYSWVAMKVGLRYSHPLDFAALRTGLGAALLFAIIVMRKGSVALASHRMALLLGLLQVGLFVVLSNYALALTGTGRTSVLVYTMPFWMIVFAHLMLRERMRGAQWIAVALAFSGLVLIVSPWRLTSLAGSLLAVLAGAVWAFCAVLSKRWPTRADPMLFTAWQVLYGFAALALIALIHPHDGIRWTAEFGAALFFSSALGVAMGWWLWTYVLSRSQAGIAGLNTLGIPVVAVLSSAWQLGERPPPVELAGMALVGIALVLLAVSGLRRPRPGGARA